MGLRYVAPYGWLKCIKHQHQNSKRTTRWSCYFPLKQTDLPMYQCFNIRLYQSVIEMSWGKYEWYEYLSKPLILVLVVLISLFFSRGHEYKCIWSCFHFGSKCWYTKSSYTWLTRILSPYPKKLLEKGNFWHQQRIPRTKPISAMLYDKLE